MNKLIKVAMIVAGVGAMLSFVGCGKENANKGVAEDTKVASNNGATKDVSIKSVGVATKNNLSPAEEIVSFARRINAELVKHGAKPLVSEEEIDQCKKLSSEEAQEQLVLMRSTFPLLMSYSSLVKEVNEFFKKTVGNPYLDKEKILERFGRFVKDTSEDQQAIVSRLKLGFPLLQRYASIVKEGNDLCKKLGGKPLVKDEYLADKFESFLDKSNEAQQEEITEAQNVLKEIKKMK